MEITLRQLRYFDALAQHGHFGRAAEACAISQPALSIQIKELEQTLGTALVERSARALRLTGFGRNFAAKSREILRAVDDLAELARAEGGALRGSFRFGVIPTVAPYLLPHIVTELARHFPALELRPRESVTQRLLEDLIAGQLDAAILALPVSIDTLETYPLFAEEFVLVRPKADADQPVPPAAKLKEMRLLLLEEGHCFRDQALSFCKLSPGSRNDLMEGSSLATLVQMVSAGIGVTLIPEMAIPIETRSAEVSVARLEAPRPSRKIGLVWRRSSPLAAQFRQIGATIAQMEGRARSDLGAIEPLDPVKGPGG